MRYQSIPRLVDGGDWACSWGEPTGLQEVCDELEGLLEPALAVRASKIARLAAADMAAAARQWRDLVSLMEHVGHRETNEARGSLR